VEYLIIAAAAVTLVFLINMNLDSRAARRALPVLLVAFTVRLVIHVLVMRGNIIDYGGDNLHYELKALEIVEYWRREGFQYVTSDEIAGLHTVTVPCQIFAIVIYLCDGPASLACTAVVALAACALCIMMYKLARLIGADERAAFILLTVTAFMPAFLLHTSDTYKDGFNAFLVVACLGLGFSSVRNFDVRKLLLLGPLLWALWHVRPYMVFMCAVPLIFSVAIFKRALSPHGMLVFGAVLLSALLFIAPLEAMQEQLEYGQSENVRRANALGSSGVLFEDSGRAWEALGLKLVYTLMAPFPWADGSLTLQLGKIDVLIWYYLFYSAVRGVRRLWRYDRGMVLILLMFIVPSTVVYATSMANIGLIFRQRIPIVMIVSLLSAVAWTRISREKQQPATPLPDKNSGSTSPALTPNH
jgi:hypothetical protein